MHVGASHMCRRSHDRRVSFLLVLLRLLIVGAWEYRRPPAVLRVTGLQVGPDARFDVDRHSPPWGTHASLLRPSVVITRRLLAHLRVGRTQISKSRFSGLVPSFTFLFVFRLSSFASGFRASERAAPPVLIKIQRHMVCTRAGYACHHRDHHFDHSEPQETMLSSI
ncbi:hypothetical protein L227DRAFT_153822 [Lentinus tigrinus ALCF2SS1-6]|uniref:Secreted protein n=1 Tax=Lentinus tigrinus ALCF2SS1-6 TaxID=1328759 RepID=A0A5C2S7B4_9APHY|nr:hypothetical protein L227DRAFT_153822 [Lentinus tigrinus ALCF2SS1-6]